MASQSSGADFGAISASSAAPANADNHSDGIAPEQLSQTDLSYCVAVEALVEMACRAHTGATWRPMYQLVRQRLTQLHILPPPPAAPAATVAFLDTLRAMYQRVFSDLLASAAAACSGKPYNPISRTGTGHLFPFADPATTTTTTTTTTATTARRKGGLNSCCRQQHSSSFPTSSSPTSLSSSFSSSSPPQFPVETNCGTGIGNDWLNFSRFAAEFEPVSLLGRGAFAAVCRCRSRLDRQQYAVKRVTFRVTTSTAAAAAAALREVTVLAALQHSHIVRYHTAWLEPLFVTPTAATAIDKVHRSRAATTLAAAAATATDKVHKTTATTSTDSLHRSRATTTTNKVHKTRATTMTTTAAAATDKVHKTRATAPPTTTTTTATDKLHRTTRETTAAAEEVGCVGVGGGSLSSAIPYEGNRSADSSDDNEFSSSNNDSKLVDQDSGVNKVFIGRFWASGSSSSISSSYSSSSSGSSSNDEDNKNDSEISIIWSSGGGGGGDNKNNNSSEYRFAVTADDDEDTNCDLFSWDRAAVTAPNTSSLSNRHSRVRYRKPGITKAAAAAVSRHTFHQPPPPRPSLCLYIQMQLCNSTLHHWLRERNSLAATLPTAAARDSLVDAARCCRIAADLFDALAYMHRRGVVHRDIKPANIFFDADGRVLLGDFGLARTSFCSSGGGGGGVTSQQQSITAAAGVKHSVGSFSPSLLSDQVETAIASDGGHCDDDDNGDMMCTASPSQQCLVHKTDLGLASTPSCNEHGHHRQCCHCCHDREAASGFSSHGQLAEQWPITAGVGTVPYAAPEQLSGSLCSSACDMFSMGLLVFELLQPFVTESERRTALWKMRDGDPDRFDGSSRLALLSPAIRTRWPRIAAAIIQLTSFEPQNRPTATQVLPLFRNMSHSNSSPAMGSIVSSVNSPPNEINVNQSAIFTNSFYTDSEEICSSKVKVSSCSTKVTGKSDLSGVARGRSESVCEANSSGNISSPISLARPINDLSLSRNGPHLNVVDVQSNQASSKQSAISISRANQLKTRSPAVLHGIVAAYKLCFRANKLDCRRLKHVLNQMRACHLRNIRLHRRLVCAERKIVFLKQKLANNC